VYDEEDMKEEEEEENEKENREMQEVWAEKFTLYSTEKLFVCFW
jgi:hypothetical protein